MVQYRTMLLPEPLTMTAQAVAIGSAVIAVLGAYFTMAQKQKTDETRLEKNEANINDAIQKLNNLTVMLTATVERHNVIYELSVKTIESITVRLDAQQKALNELSGTVSLITSHLLKDRKLA